ncbi:RiPP maturation radical SAM C-methyltransferase [Tenacibaculum sp.]|nr:RiPP maturation radical SAM C-methyltransferase [Tenacibaculum sp.]
MDSDKKYNLECKIRELLSKAKVLLIVPPFFNIDFIALGPYILQATAKKHKYDVDILQLDLLLANVIGVNEYKEIQESPTFQLLGERLFSRSAFQLPILGLNHDAILDQSLAISENKTGNIYYDKPSEIDIEYYKEIEQICYDFVLIVSKVIAEYSYDIIGFSLGFCNQINPSIAIINEVSKYSSCGTIIVGGSYCDGDKVAGIPSLSKHIDYVFSGESENTFINFLNLHAKGIKIAEKIIKIDEEVLLDNLPIADYENYAKQVIRIMGEEYFRENVKAIWYESSRGCWWADKAKCTFCGIGDGGFRNKSIRKVKNDIKTIQSIVPEKYIFFTDLIMPKLFPEKYMKLEINGDELPVLGMQLKINTSVFEMNMLKSINARIVLPGIESFSTSLLKKMKKGTTGRHNLYFLRNAACLNIHVQYSLIWGFPNDVKEEYDYLETLIPSIIHLKPPRLFEGAQVSRDAPLYRDANVLGVSNLEYWKVYDMVYSSNVKIAQLANYFVGSFESFAYRNPNYMNDVFHKIENWKKKYNKVSLEIRKIDNDIFLIIDNRKKQDMATISYMVSKEKATILMSLARFISDDQKWAVERELMVEMDGWYVPIITCEADLLMELDKSEVINKNKKYSLKKEMIS